MLLAFTGLRNLGIIVFDSATLLTLGGCPANRRDFLYSFPERLNQTSLAALNISNLPAPATVYGCTSQNVSPAVPWRRPHRTWGCAAGQSRTSHPYGPLPLAPSSRVEARFPALQGLCPPPPSPQMRSPTMWLGIAGGLLMAMLLYMGVKGSLIIGIT